MTAVGMAIGALAKGDCPFWPLAPKETSNPQGAMDKRRAQLRRNENCLSTVLVHGAKRI